jgi:hypothetical protein
MTEKVKKPKKIFYYGRRNRELLPEQRAKHTPKVPDEVDFILLEIALQQLDDKFYVSTIFCQRLLIHMADDLGLNRDIAEQLIALRLEHPDVKSLKKSMRNEEYYKAIVARQREHQKLLANQAWEKERKKNAPLARTGEGNYGMMGAQFGMRYFFEEKTHFLHAIEDLLKDHTDEYLQLAVDAYPRGKMGWIQYHWSFDTFWRKVSRLNTMDVVDFSEPGAKSVQRLAMYLFTWNFRRYIDGPVIYSHARFLPRLYRHLHIAAVLDRNTAREVDLEYDEVAFEDEHEEPGDNIGNR